MNFAFGENTGALLQVMVRLWTAKVSNFRKMS